VAELADEVRGGEIGPGTGVRTVAEAWYEEIKREADLGERSPDSVRTYRVCLANQVLPRLGALRLTELTVTAMDDLIKQMHDRVSFATAKTVRSVLRNVCAYAVRHQALRVNLALSVGRLVPGMPREIHVLTAEQRLDLIRRLEQFAIERRTDNKGRSLGPRARVWADRPDVVRALLATGVRLGELLALTGPDFARDGTGRPIVTIAAHIVWRRCLRFR
jgi:integrase